MPGVGAQYRHMQIPAEFRILAPTLVVAANRLHARFFLVDDNRLDERAPMDAAGFPLDDKEKYSIEVYDGIHAGGDDERILDRAGDALFRDLAARLHALLQQGAFARCIIIIANENRSMLLRHLTPDVAERVVDVIGKEMVRMHPIDIVRAAFAPVAATTE